MKKISIIISVIISLAFVSCEKDDPVSLMTFEIDGVKYTIKGGGVSCTEIFNAHLRKDVPPIHEFYNYYLMSESADAGAMHGTNDIEVEFFLQDSTDGRKLYFDASTFVGEYGFFLHFPKTGKVYQAYSGYITLNNGNNPQFAAKQDDEDFVSGKFEFYMQNYYDDEDTFLLTNGMYKYNYVEYAKSTYNILLE
jgi:hypothetical protein